MNQKETKPNWAEQKKTFAEQLKQWSEVKRGIKRLQKSIKKTEELYEQLPSKSERHSNVGKQDNSSKTKTSKMDND